MDFNTLHKVMKRTRAYHVILIFVIFVFAVSLVFYLIEDGISNYAEALWYSYVNLFTIGFGDVVVQNPISRILSVCLTIYATLVIAIITGVVVTWFQESARRRFRINNMEVIKKLTHLEDCSKEELQEISEHMADKFDFIKEKK